ncbi:Flp pilus assembly protein TadD, contains TPR repeats [Faunimonas pinastri]|uniref:Flp pilus assembly protein TadD, contains TPR repeats n=1 Tax=Faunimonas pinastri TaxID=1855383 RepID=A0A1H9HHA4_9HYPH|nr:tetratricopeptide repeat protein [Faunimonas pinastri]SEQ61652.1 Flp pilus assembly protein TadD, contains TPR repeats [Faunimonas pinastri]
MRRRFTRRSFPANTRPLWASLTLVAALASAGCQTTHGGPQTGAIPATATIEASHLSPEQAVAEVQKWGAAYSRDPKSKEAELNYAAALRAVGQTGQAVALMRKAVIYHPEDREVLADFGKALADDGEFPEALSTVRRAQRQDNPDWQLLATEGGILDSMGDHEGARARYNQALVLAPGEPQVMNNLAMSYVLTGNLSEAEELLTKAAADPRASLRVRQNLALVQDLKAHPEKAASYGNRQATAPPPAAIAAPARTARFVAPQPLPTAGQDGDALYPTEEPPPATEENTWAELKAKG